MTHDRVVFHQPVNSCDPPRVLLLDGDAPSRTLFKALIQRTRSHAQVTEASSLSAGLEATRLEQPDLVFLELRLHGGSALDYLRRLPNLRTSPTVVVVTADVFAARRDNDDLLALGVRGVLLKPLPFDAFETLLLRLIGPQSIA